MKRISDFPLHKSINFILVLSLFSFLMSSCSWIEGQRTGSSSKPKGKAYQTVSKEQYDQLLKKYESLVKDKQIANTKVVDAKPGVSKGSGPLVETVDIFSKPPQAKTKLDYRPQVDIIDQKVSGDMVENHLLMLRKAEALVAQNRFDEALTVLKEIENSPVKQVRAHAKHYLGNILFQQKEYDLALQVYEEVIHNYALSSVVLNSLGKLIVCCEKLNLKQKRDQYYSILHDFFEVN